MHVTNEYKIELSDSNDNQVVLNKFSDLVIKDNHLVVKEEKLSDVVSYMLVNDIKFISIEKIELNLESFFMEVITKWMH